MKKSNFCPKKWSSFHYPILNQLHSSISAHDLNLYADFLSGHHNSYLSQHSCPGCGEYMPYYQLVEHVTVLNQCPLTVDHHNFLSQFHKNFWQYAYHSLFPMFMIQSNMIRQFKFAQFVMEIPLPIVHTCNLMLIIILCCIHYYVV